MAHSVSGGWRFRQDGRVTRATNAALFFLPLVAGAIGTIPTVQGLRVWYRTLDKPSWTPPDRAFGPVWTTLYLLMGAALVLLRRPSRPDADPEIERRRRTTALRLFGTQLGLNVAWSFLFFGARAITAAGIEIVALWGVLAATVVASWPVRRLAAVLLLPYLAWTTLATALNFEIWRRNR